MSDCNTSEELMAAMIAWFGYRTNLHINLVKKYLDKIIALDLPELNHNLLLEEKAHDRYKWENPEYEPYLHISWRYKMRDQGVEYVLPPNTEAKLREATYHHVKNHKHHPEYWDDSTIMDCINQKDRDAIPSRQVDATKMPLDYVASMCADWMAMSEEKGTSISDWVKKNVNVRWKFTQRQEALIAKLTSSIKIDILTKENV